MKTLALFSIIGLLAACKLGASNDSNASTAPNEEKGKTIAICTAISDKSGSKIVENAEVEEDNGKYKIVYKYTTTTGTAKEAGTQTTEGVLLEKTKTAVSGDLSVSLKEASMVTQIGDRTIKQKFDKLLVKLEKGRLHMSDNGALVLDLGGCQ